MDNNQFVDLKGFEDKYEISVNYPHDIRIKKSKKILQGIVDKDGYYTVYLNKKPYFTYELIATQFIPNPNPKSKPCVKHINRNTEDNRIENLKWVSTKEYYNISKDNWCGINIKIND